MSYYEGIGSASPRSVLGPRGPVLTAVAHPVLGECRSLAWDAAAEVYVCKTCRGKFETVTEFEQHEPSRRQ